jgi:hypothetical protein
MSPPFLRNARVTGTGACAEPARGREPYSAEKAWPFFSEESLSRRDLTSVSHRLFGLRGDSQNAVNTVDGLLSVRLGDLADKLGPTHVHRPVNFSGFRARIVLENFHHQGRVVRDDDAGL